MSRVGAVRLTVVAAALAMPWLPIAQVAQAQGDSDPHAAQKVALLRLAAAVLTKEPSLIDRRVAAVPESGDPVPRLAARWVLDVAMKRDTDLRASETALTAKFSAGSKEAHLVRVVKFLDRGISLADIRELSGRGEHAPSRETLEVARLVFAGIAAWRGEKGSFAAALRDMALLADKASEERHTLLDEPYILLNFAIGIELLERGLGPMKAIAVALPWDAKAQRDVIQFAELVQDRADIVERLKRVAPMLAGGHGIGVCAAAVYMELTWGAEAGLVYDLMGQHLASLGPEPQAIVKACLAARDR